MAYTQIWETLAEALRRLVAAGQAEPDAKLDLCNAIADGAIDFKLVLFEHAGRPEITVSAAGLDLSGGILPNEIDWQLSRPIKAWPFARQQPHQSAILHIAGGVGHHIERTIKTIKVRSSNVSRLLGLSSPVSTPSPAQDRPRPKSGLGAKSEGVEDAIRHLWPGGIPAGLTAKDRNKNIREFLRHRGVSSVSTRTIERALRTTKNRLPGTD